MLVMDFRLAVLSVIVVLLSEVRAKVYHRCELAYELRDVHEIPENQLATWLCIANYESHFNTSAHNPGSGDHGLFQISEIYWCSPPGGGVACGLPCSALKDDDIEDDVICARRIYREHKKLSGDGFTAWVVYNRYCRNPAHVAKFLQGCFDRENIIKYGYEPIYQAMNLPTVTVPMPTEGITEVPPSSQKALVPIAIPATPSSLAITPPEPSSPPPPVETSPEPSPTPSAPSRSSPAPSKAPTKPVPPYKPTFFQRSTGTSRFPTPTYKNVPTQSTPGGGLRITTKKPYTYSTYRPFLKETTPTYKPSSEKHQRTVDYRRTQPTYAGRVQGTTKKPFVAYSTYKPFLKQTTATPRAQQTRRPSSRKYQTTGDYKRKYSSSFGSNFGATTRATETRRTQTPLPFTLKSGVMPFRFGEGEKVYAFVNRGGYAFAISSNGFKLFKTD